MSKDFNCKWYRDLYSIPIVNDTEIYIRNFMVSYNIPISSAYAHYSIFKEDLILGISKFQTSVNVRGISLTKLHLHIWNAN